MEPFSLTAAATYLTAAVLAVPIAQRLGLGSVLGYLIAGIIIGPFVLGFIDDATAIMHFAEFGVVMMLFLVGLELEPAKLWRLRKSIIGTGGLQVLLMMGIVAGVGLLLALPWQSALVVGMAMAMSSTAIALQLINERGLMNASSGQAGFSILLFEDIAVIPMLAVIPLLAATGGFGVEHVAIDPAPLETGHLTDPTSDHGHGGGDNLIAHLPGYLQALVILGVLAGIVLGGRYVLRPIFRFIARARVREIFTATSLLLVIGVALLMDQLGLSMALGTFIAGVVLADSEYRHEIESDIEPFKGLLLGLFFISVGMAINFALVAQHPFLVVGLVVALVLFKLLFLYGLGRVTGLTNSSAILFALFLAQGGEFAFVLLQFGVTNGALESETSSILTAVVALSMATTPLLLLAHDKLLAPRLAAPHAARDEDDMEDMDNPVIIAGHGRFGQIIGRVLTAAGIGTTVLDHDPDQVDLLRDFGFKVFYGDATRLDLLHSAGLSRAKILVVAIDNHQKAMELTAAARHTHPELKILVRATGRVQAYELFESGADFVQRELFDGSLNLSTEVLHELGMPRHRALRLVKGFAHMDRKALREAYPIRGDREKLKSLSAQNRDETAKLLARMTAADGNQADWTQADSSLSNKSSQQIDTAEDHVG